MMRDHASGPRLFRTPWFMPLFCLALGALTAGALALGGQRSSAVFSLILFAFNRRQANTSTRCRWRRRISS